MDFMSKLLQGIAFIPGVVNGIEGLFGSRGVAQPGSAPALGARSFLPLLPSPAFVSNVFNNWGTLLLAQS